MAICNESLLMSADRPQCDKCYGRPATFSASVQREFGLRCLCCDEKL